MRRLYLPPEEFAVAEVDLRGARARRLRDVLRLRDGAALRVFDGLGAEREATVVVAHGESGAEGPGGRIRSTPRAASLRLALGAAVRPLPEPPVAVTVVCAFPRGQRGDWLVEKATELGAHRLVAVQADRSVLRPGAGRLARWRRVAIEAAEQCGRATLPDIGGAPPPGALALLVDVAAELGLRERLATVTLPATGIALHVGPEGGWSAAERAALLASGALPVSLGPRTLRVETAAIVALAQALEATGGLRSAAVRSGRSPAGYGVKS